MHVYIYFIATRQSPKLWNDIDDFELTGLLSVYQTMLTTYVFSIICPYKIYPIYTCTLAMAEPWPSEVLFTLGELYPRQTGQHRRDCLGEDLGEGQV